MKLQIKTFLFAWILISTHVFAASEIWHKNFTTKPSWQSLLPNGDLIVSQNSRLSVYNADNGEEMWQRDDLWVTYRSDIRMLGQSGLLLAEVMPAAMQS